GSAVQVARTIDQALARGLRPHLSITVTARNAGSLPEAVAFALDRGLLFNLNFYREQDLESPFPALTPDGDRLIAALRQALAVIEERLPPYNLIAGLLDRVSLAAPHRYPCGVGHAYLVVGPRGQVARCQMELERPVTDIWTEDPLTPLRAVNGGFRNLPVEQREGCRTCPWRYWCAGGCPLLTHRLTGRSDRPSPYCRVYKTLFPEMLRLEGLRLLRWQDRRAQAAGR
ncbi:MAG: SPASM domain-containing protein, partial [Chloroflexi bacterium]